jgi:hypothetical protein
MKEKKKTVKEKTKPTKEKRKKKKREKCVPFESKHLLINWSREEGKWKDLIEEDFVLITQMGLHLLYQFCWARHPNWFLRRHDFRRNDTRANATWRNDICCNATKHNAILAKYLLKYERPAWQAWLYVQITAFRQSVVLQDVVAPAVSGIDFCWRWQCVEIS